LHQRKLALTLVALLALAAIIAGCGGGSSSSSGSTTTENDSAKAVFIKEADKICSKAEAKLTGEITKYAEKNGITVTEGKEPSGAQQIKIFHAVVLPNIGRQAKEIAALTPPKGDEGTVEDITETLAKEVSEAEEEKGGVADGGTFARATEKAHAYGLKTCGN
jgi:hypothetical protein